MLRRDAELMYDGEIPAYMLDEPPPPRSSEQRLLDARETVMDWIAAAKISRDTLASGREPSLPLGTARAYLRASLRDFRAEQRRAAFSRRAS